MKVITKNHFNSSIEIGIPCYFDWMNRKLIPYGTKLPVAFSSKELDDIRSCIMIGEEFGRHAVVDGKRFRLNL